MKDGGLSPSLGLSVGVVAVFEAGDRAGTLVDGAVDLAGGIALAFCDDFVGTLAFAVRFCGGGATTLP